MDNSNNKLENKIGGNSGLASERIATQVNLRQPTIKKNVGIQDSLQRGLQLADPPI